MRFLVTEKLGPHKFKTPEGYLICTDAILSRTGKQEYRRCELFGDACEDPDKIVNVDRTDAEVFSDKAMASFENKPVCIEHPDHDVNAENHNELAVGFVRDIHKGEDNGKPVMMGTLVITDKDAVEAVESGEYKELSCGYDCDIDDDDEPCQRNIRGNHVALCKHGRAGVARIVDSVDDAGIKVWQVRQGYAIVVKRYWKQYGRNAFVDATESSIEAARYHRGSLERNDKMDFVIIDCNDGKYKIEDSEMKDIQSTKAPGTDKIIYVMQSDIDKNLYFYIGKTFSMKEGSWGYTKFEMGDDTPEKIKAELARNGWHQVASGPARIIDASNEEWTVVEEENYEKANKAVIDEEYVQLPRGRFKVVEKTKEELEREGYGYHHSANGYSVYVKNNNAVAIKDSINDAKTEYIFNWRDTYHGTKDKTRVDASSIKEAIKKFGDIIALGGIGTANCYVISISPNDGYMRAYGKLSELLRTFKDYDVKDAADVMLSGRYVYFDFAEVKGKSLKQEIERKYNSKFNEKIKVKRLDKHWVPGKKEVEIQVFADGMHENYDGFWAVVQATEEESKQLKDDWTEAEEKNYEKTNKPVGAKDETEKNFKIYVKNAFGAYKVADWPAVSKEAAVKEFLEMNPAYRNKGIIEARDSVNDSKKEQLFTIEYEQDGVMYVRKVRASSIEDAISKVKDVYNKFEHETDKEYLKSSINEMSSYISNWSFMTTREKRNISPEGLGALKQMLKFAQQRLAELK